MAVGKHDGYCDGLGGMVCNGHYYGELMDIDERRVMKVWKRWKKEKGNVLLASIVRFSSVGQTY